MAYKYGHGHDQSIIEIVISFFGPRKSNNLNNFHHD